VRRFAMPVLRNGHGDTDVRDEVRLKRLTNLRLLQIASDDGHRTLVLTGELDLTSFWLLDHPLLQIGTRGAKSFTLDLSGLDFIDSTGVRSVLAARGFCAARGCEFIVIAGPPQVQRVFEASGHIAQLPFKSRRSSDVART
jgi:anti-anti-sigma factor